MRIACSQSSAFIITKESSSPCSATRGRHQGCDLQEVLRRYSSTKQCERATLEVQDAACRELVTTIGALRLPRKHVRIVLVGARGRLVS
jgi:hypothetical protein